MIKNVAIIILVFLMSTSCGKKGCPKHPDNQTDKCNPIYYKS